MEKTLEGPAKAQWQTLHMDYVMAHEQYMLAKLAREAAMGQPSDLASAQNAREKLITAQEAMAAFCQQHAEYC